MMTPPSLQYHSSTRLKMPAPATSTCVIEREKKKMMVQKLVSHHEKHDVKGRIQIKLVQFTCHLNFIKS
jgi:hypothetical protein